MKNELSGLVAPDGQTLPSHQELSLRVFAKESGVWSVAAFHNTMVRPFGANAMRENARAEASAPQQPPAGATAVDDLRAYIRYSEVELAGLKKMLPALEALYATLSPAQKKAADAAFRQGPGG